MQRRTFLTTISAGMLVGACTKGSSGRLIQNVGLGLFSIPHLLEVDVEGTMAMLAEIGYKEIELYGPYPFSVPSAHERWAGLTPQLGFEGSGYYGHSPTEFRRMLDRYGLTAPSIHVDLETLRTRLDQVAEAANTLGHDYAGIAAIPEEARQTLDDYRSMADEFNEIGRRASEQGFKFLYHNHGYGLAPVEGQIPLQLLLERLDPEAIALEMDVYWTVAGGADPVEYLKAYPGLYRLMHVKDMTERVRFSGDGGNPEQWMALFPYMTSAGNGVLDLPHILRTARANGVEHFFVEYDLAPDPETMLRDSHAYLASLEG